jgi:predicted HicB family RNase H-like nuclease
VPITVRLEPQDAAKLRQECKRLGVSQAQWVAGKVNREK